MKINLRTQPIGIFPLPANLLLLSEEAENSDYYKNLLKGIYSGEAPQNLLFYKFAVEGNVEESIKNLPENDLPETKFNRFILESSTENYEELKKEFSGEFLKILEVAAYTLNFISEPPEVGEANGEIAALILLSQASHKLENGEVENSIELLKKAIEFSRTVSPIFSAQIKGNLAETLHQFEGANSNVMLLYQQAIKELEKTELDFYKASLNLNLGICFQEMANGRREVLLESVRCYQKSLNFFKADDFPEQFALAQNNLALAYFSMPLTEASDQLRVAIAVQSLREVLKIWTREHNANGWATAQLNLANALQYLPSKHVEENLMEAVNLYEEILQVRKPEENPVGFARLLSNQGNALAHLGIFEHAIPKLTEAKGIFEQNGENDSANSIAEILSEINAQTSQKQAVAGN